MFAAGKQRLKVRKKALKKLEELFETSENVFLIHYSCESFIDNTTGSNKTTSIAVRNLSTGQTRSFSIHQTAERHNIPLEQIHNQYQIVEQHLLREFFTYVATIRHAKWVHWNMRDINYGFISLEHRATILGVTPTVIPDEKKYDLSRILIDLYGQSYIGHPRLPTLVAKNKMSTIDFLSGEDESKAYLEGHFSKLHKSTLRKVDLFENILDQIDANNLKVDSNWREIYGISPQSLGNFLKDHWVPVLIAAIIAIISFGLSLIK